METYSFDLIPRCFREITNPTLLAHMEIYDILYCAKAPLYVHKSIIKCIMRSIDKGAFEYNHNDYSRKTFLKTICRKHATANPTIVPVHLENLLKIPMSKHMSAFG